MAVDVTENRELKERVVEINRVAKVVKGGRRFSFTALVVIGDEVDRVGVGYGKAREVPLAISKAVDDAKKNLFQVPKSGQTITHETIGEFDAARVLLRPASEGTGVIAGGGVRAILELAGIRDILAKSLGTTNPINMAKATVDGLKKLRRPEQVAQSRGKTISEVLPVGAPADGDAAVGDSPDGGQVVEPTVAQAAEAVEPEGAAEAAPAAGSEGGESAAEGGEQSGEGIVERVQGAVASVKEAVVPGGGEGEGLLERAKHAVKDAITPGRDEEDERGQR